MAVQRKGGMVVVRGKIAAQGLSGSLNIRQGPSPSRKIYIGTRDFYQCLPMFGCSHKKIVSEQLFVSLPR